MDGGRPFLHSDWKRGLELLRDSLNGRYGELVVGAPWLPANCEAAAEQRLEPLATGAGIQLEPLFDARIRAREFWLREAQRFRERLRPLFDRAQVVHTGLDDLYRPMMELAFVGAVRRGLPTVFVQDTDAVQQIRELTPRSLHEQAKTALYTSLYETTCRLSVARADLALLKGRALMGRYAHYAKNAREFHNTSYLSSEVASEREVERRLGTLTEPRPLRLVYCGRLVARKGLIDSVRLLRSVRERGANVELDLIGQGPLAASLRSEIERAGLGQHVRLLGARRYDPPLLRELSTYDAMLFTPTAEDTPRMIFDGYAAGLPLIAVEIPYVRERAVEERATLLLPRGDLELAAERIARVDRSREQLASLSWAALHAGRHHAADRWYARRAEWTHEAVQAHAGAGLHSRLRAARAA